MRHKKSVPALLASGVLTGVLMFSALMGGSGVAQANPGQHNGCVAIFSIGVNCVQSNWQLIPPPPPPGGCTPGCWQPPPPPPGTWVWDGGAWTPPYPPPYNAPWGWQWRWDGWNWVCDPTR